MPEPAVRQIGEALGDAQCGKHPDAKPRTGPGSGVFAVVNYFNKYAYRAAYVVWFEKAIYVLHCLQKKSPSGSRTVKTDMDLTTYDVFNGARQ